MNFTLDDRHRSLRRFLMAALGSPPWVLRTERQPIADEERPAGVVEQASPAATLRARATVPQGEVEKQQTFSIMLYSELAATAAEAGLIARAWAERLDGAITVGLVNDDGSPYSPPLRIPVFDYAGVPMKGAGRGGAAEPYGWLWVEDAPVRAVQDPDDPVRWSIVCDMRVSWEQGGRIVDPALPVAGSSGGVFAP